MAPVLEVVPVLPRVAIREGLRAVVPLGPPRPTAAVVDAATTRLPLVVATVGHTVLTGLVRTQVPEGPGPIVPEVARLLVPAGPLRPIAVGLRATAPGLEVATRPTTLTGLAVAAIPARCGAARPTGVLRAQVPAPFVAIGRPTDGALVSGVPPQVADVGVLRLTTKASQAFPIDVVARHVGPGSLEPSPAQALDAKALAALATGARLPYVGKAATTIGPALRHADGPTEGLPVVVPLRPSAANGAATEETLPEVRPAEGP